MIVKSILSCDSPEQIFEQALRCLSSWVQFGIPLTELEEVTQLVFHALNNDVYFDTAIDTLVQIFVQHENYRLELLEIVYMVYGYASFTITCREMTLVLYYSLLGYRYPNTVSKLLPHVLNLRTMWFTAEEKSEMVSNHSMVCPPVKCRMHKKR